MHRLFSFILIMMSPLLLMAVSLPPDKAAHISDSLLKVLDRTTDTRQRVNLRYDIFDLAPADRVIERGREVIEEARKANDISSQLDMYRRLTSFSISRDSSLINQFADEIRKLPASPERSATECFALICSMRAQARFATEDAIYRNIAGFIHSYERECKAKSPVNDRMVHLFALVSYLQMPGNTLTSYLDELEHLLKNMPYRLDGLENMFYLHSAILYTDNEMPARANAADRELLKVIDRLDHKAKEQGRKYRDYDRFRYSVYRRMLTNAESLSPEEVERIYNEIKRLQKTDFEVAEDMAINPLAEAAYYVAKGRYAQAAPLLEQSLKQARTPSAQRHVLQMIIKATSNNENHDMLIAYAPRYISLLESTIRNLSSQTGQEMQALINLADGGNSTGSVKELESEISAAKSRLAIAAFILLLLLVGAIVTLIIFYRRTKRLSAKLEEANDNLAAERENLSAVKASLIEARDKTRAADRHKNDFISNMSHEVSTPLNTITECAHLIVDNVPHEKRKYLDRFARAITVSADMLRTLINDVLKINELESGTLVIERETVPVTDICQTAIESMRMQIKPGVELKWEPKGVESEVIYTDPKRVEQVLVNLLSNGLKFTEKGYVELACSIDKVMQTVTFTVTDTGIGVPEGKEEIIFNRFEKLSPMTQGTGLGLNISRMIANLLNGKLYVDTSYKGEGTRFVFTIPSMP